MQNLGPQPKSPGSEIEGEREEESVLTSPSVVLMRFQAGEPLRRGLLAAQGVLNNRVNSSPRQAPWPEGETWQTVEVSRDDYSVLSENTEIQE